MLTQKQENFCTNIVLDGMTQHDAYATAYDAENMLQASIDERACVLAGESKIATRISDLRAETRSNKVCSIKERKEILSEILRGKTSHFVNEQGIIDKKKLDSHAIQAVDEQTIGGMATVVKLKLHNKVLAIAELNKMEGVYEPDKGNTYNDNRSIYIQVKDRETAQILSGMAERTEELPIGNEQAEPRELQC